MRYYISKYSIYTFLFCLTYLLLRWVFVSFLEIPRILISNHMYLHEVILCIASGIIIKKCFKVNRLD